MSSKTCTKCKVIKPETDFNFRHRDRNIRHGYCRECGKNYTRNHYKNRKELYLKRNRKYYAKRREIVIKAKEKPCADCGIEFPYYVMDFDHREGEKKCFSLHRIFNATEKKILKEIAKCDVVCANCHRERTYQRMLKNQKNQIL